MITTTGLSAAAPGGGGRRAAAGALLAGVPSSLASSGGPIAVQLPGPGETLRARGCAEVDECCAVRRDALFETRGEAQGPSPAISPRLAGPGVTEVRHAAARVGS